MQILPGPLGRPIRLAVFLSGGGRTLVNLVDCIGRGELDAEIAVVVSDRASFDHIQPFHTGHRE